jgi:hypothetical protein
MIVAPMAAERNNVILENFKAMTTAEQILDAFEEIARRMLSERGISTEVEAYEALRADPADKKLDALWRILSIAQTLRTDLAAEILDFDEIVRKSALLMLLAAEIADTQKVGATIH